MHGGSEAAESLFATEWALEDLGTGRGPTDPEPETGVELESREETALVAEEPETVVAEQIGVPVEDHERAVGEAYERGYEAGRQAGEEAEAARLRTALQVAEIALDEVRESEVRWTGAIEENICGLAVAVARQIIGEEMTTTPEAVLELVTQAIAEFPVDQPLRIRVNPRDLATIEGIGTETDAPGVLQRSEARWVGDTRIAPGGCVVEGRERIVDGRIDTALERIYRRLTYSHV